MLSKQHFWLTIRPITKYDRRKTLQVPSHRKEKLRRQKSECNVFLCNEFFVYVSWMRKVYSKNKIQMNKNRIHLNFIFSVLGRCDTYNVHVQSYVLRITLLISLIFFSSLRWYRTINYDNWKYLLRRCFHAVDYYRLSIILLQSMAYNNNSYLLLLCSTTNVSSETIKSSVLTAKQ